MGLGFLLETNDITKAKSSTWKYAMHVTVIINENDPILIRIKLLFKESQWVLCKINKNKPITRPITYSKMQSIKDKGKNL